VSRTIPQHQHALAQDQTTAAAALLSDRRTGCPESIGELLHIGGDGVGVLESGGLAGLVGVADDRHVSSVRCFDVGRGVANEHSLAR
jgi:hypothetical protein